MRVELLPDVKELALLSEPVLVGSAVRVREVLRAAEEAELVELDRMLEESLLSGV